MSSPHQSELPTFLEMWNTTAKGQDQQESFARDITEILNDKTWLGHRALAHISLESTVEPPKQEGEKS
jgi:hypothetical protein